MFKCDCCGLCCMQVGSSPLYYEFDRGDGICRYFNCETKLCTIYATRPIQCNVEEAYELYFKNDITRDEYYRYNYEVCEKLKRKGVKECI